MKILYVISDRNVGGAGIQLCGLLRNLDRRRFDPVVALPYGSALRARLLALRVPVHELEHPCSRVSAASVRELLGVVRAVSPDVVHANAALCARIAGRLSGRPVVHTRHCCFPAAQAGNPLLRGAERWANRLLSDRVIATSASAARALVREGIPRSAIWVILNGAEPVRPVPEAELAVWRQRLNLGPQDYCVGLCARLEPCKGHETFLRAAALASAAMPERRFRFLIVGDGSRRRELEGMVRALGLEEAVRMTGFVQDVAPVYRLLRIHVSCSVSETSCLAVSEGMSASLPTLVSSAPGNRAMLGQSGAGFCFPVGDAAALSAAICRIAADPSLENALRHAAYRRYSARFTARAMTRRVEALYRTL